MSELILEKSERINNALNLMLIYTKNLVEEILHGNLNADIDELCDLQQDLESAFYCIKIAKSQLLQIHKQISNIELPLAIEQEDSLPERVKNRVNIVEDFSIFVKKDRKSEAIEWAKTLDHELVAESINLQTLKKHVENGLLLPEELFLINHNLKSKVKPVAGGNPVPEQI